MSTSLALSPDLVNAVASVVAARIAADRGVMVSDLGLMESPDHEDQPWSVIILSFGGKHADIVVGDVPEADADRGASRVFARLDSSADWIDGTLDLPAHPPGPALSYRLADLRRDGERLARARAGLRSTPPRGEALAAVVTATAGNHRVPLLEAIRRWLRLRTADVTWLTDGSALRCEGRGIGLAADGRVVVDGMVHAFDAVVPLAPGLDLRADLAIQAEWPWLGIGDVADGALESGDQPTPPRTGSGPGTA